MVFVFIDSVPWNTKNYVRGCYMEEEVGKRLCSVKCLLCHSVPNLHVVIKTLVG
jgi:hypothetical protein